MTKQELLDYIEKLNTEFPDRDNQTLAIKEVKAMHEEGSPLTIELLDKRLHPERVNFDADTFSKLYKTNAVFKEAVDREFEKLSEGPTMSRDQFQEALIRQYDKPKEKKSGVLSLIITLISFVLILALGCVIVLVLAPNSDLAFLLDNMIQKLTGFNLAGQALQQ